MTIKIIKFFYKHIIDWQSVRFPDSLLAVSRLMVLRPPHELHNKPRKTHRDTQSLKLRGVEIDMISSQICKRFSNQREIVGNDRSVMY